MVVVGGSTSRIRETLWRRQIPAVFFQNVRLEEASKSTITVLINHMASVLAQIDAGVAIKAQTSQRQGETTRRFLPRPPLFGCCERQCKKSQRGQCAKLTCVIAQNTQNSKQTKHMLEYGSARRMCGGVETRFDRTRRPL